MVDAPAIAAIYRQWSHEHANYLNSAEAALVEHLPVWSARYLIVSVVFKKEDARRAMLAANARDRWAVTYREIINFQYWDDVLISMAHACGHPGHVPEVELFPVAQNPALEVERARQILQAGTAELRRAPERQAMLLGLLLKDARVSKKGRDEYLAALTGLVDATFSLEQLKHLKVALKREGIERSDDEFVYLLSEAVFEVLEEQPQIEGLSELRSAVSNALRRPRETEQHKFEIEPRAELREEVTPSRASWRDAAAWEGRGEEHTRSYRASEIESAARERSGEPGEEARLYRPSEIEMAAWMVREERMRIVRWMNQKMEHGKLSPNERQVLRMAQMLSNTEIAERTGRPANQIRQEKLRARNKLLRVI